jgi:hypothetical protein
VLVAALSRRILTSRWMANDFEPAWPRSGVPDLSVTKPNVDLRYIPQKPIAIAADGVANRAAMTAAPSEPTTL